MPEFLHPCPHPSLHHHRLPELSASSVELEVLRLCALGGLEVCAEFVHAIKCLGEEGPTAVDLHQGQVIQLKQKASEQRKFGLQKTNLTERTLVSQ